MGIDSKRVSISSTVWSLQNLRIYSSSHAREVQSFLVLGNRE
jgi:hypothetical protein